MHVGTITSQQKLHVNSCY